MVQDRISREKPLRRVAAVFERSGDLIALGGGMIGLALIVGVIIVGLHERETSFRSMTPAHHSDTAG
jgi:hypothetical protein